VVRHYHSLHPFLYAVWGGYEKIEKGQFLGGFRGGVVWAGEEICHVWFEDVTPLASVELFSPKGAFPFSKYFYDAHGQTYFLRQSRFIWQHNVKRIEAFDGDLKSFRVYREEGAFAFPMVFDAHGMFNRSSSFCPPIDNLLSVAMRSSCRERYDRLLKFLEKKRFEVTQEMRDVVVVVPRMLMKPNRFFPNLAILEANQNRWIWCVRGLFSFITEPPVLQDRFGYMILGCPRSCPELSRPISRYHDCLTYLFKQREVGKKWRELFGKHIRIALSECGYKQFYSLSRETHEQITESLCRYVQGKVSLEECQSELAYALLVNTTT
jgi:hypothetical protein